jgi:hypothetical protein
MFSFVLPCGEPVVGSLHRLAALEWPSDSSLRQAPPWRSPSIDTRGFFQAVSVSIPRCFRQLLPVRRLSRWMGEDESGVPPTDVLRAAPFGIENVAHVDRTVGASPMEARPRRRIGAPWALSSMRSDLASLSAGAAHTWQQLTIPVPFQIRRVSLRPQLCRKRGLAIRAWLRQFAECLINDTAVLHI